MRFWVRGYPPPLATVVVAVNRQAGANAVEVAKSVRDLLPLISAELPGSVRVTPIYDRSQTIIHSVIDVQMTLAIAFAARGVGDLHVSRTGERYLDSGDGFAPFSALTFIAMELLGYSLDNLSLMALTLGHRLPGGRRHRVFGEHRAPDGARRESAGGDDQQR